jgi:small subunit ribosomal protein S1
MENTEVPSTSPSNSGGEDEFAKSLGELLASGDRYDPPKKNQLVSGRITALSDREILVDLGAKSEGIVSGKEIEAIPKDVRKAMAIGEEVYAYVIAPEDRNGNVVLSIARAVAERDWTFAEELHKKQEAHESMIAGFNKGGVIVKVGRLRGFVPASQLSMQHQRMLGDESQPPEQRYQKLVGQKTLVKVIVIDRERNRLILSERAASKEAREAQKSRLLTSIEIGSIVEGNITSVKEFGAFVDLGGADGMIHLSEMSHQRIKHPSEILKEGQSVKVKVISLDRDGGRIGLSLKALMGDPWADIGKRFKAGQLVEGEIIKTHPKHGAFARLKDDPAIEGLIPLSELSDRQISNPREVVKEGQTVTLRVLRVEPEQKRLALSLKRVSYAEYADTDYQGE